MKFKRIEEREFWERAVIKLTGADGWTAEYAVQQADVMLKAWRERIDADCPAQCGVKNV